MKRFDGTKTLAKTSFFWGVGLQQQSEEKISKKSLVLAFEVILHCTTTHTQIIYCTIFQIFKHHCASAAAEMVVTCISSVYTNPACCLPFDGCCTRWSMTGLEIHLFEHSNHMLRRGSSQNWELRRVGTNWCRFDEVVCLSLALKLCGNKVFLCFLTFCFVSKKYTAEYYDIHYDLTPNENWGWRNGDTDFCTNRNNKHVLKWWWWLYFENIRRSKPLIVIGKYVCAAKCILHT